MRSSTAMLTSPLIIPCATTGHYTDAASFTSSTLGYGPRGYEGLDRNSTTHAAGHSLCEDYTPTIMSPCGNNKWISKCANWPEENLQTCVSVDPLYPPVCHAELKQIGKNAISQQTEDVTFPTAVCDTAKTLSNIKNHRILAVLSQWVIELCWTHHNCRS